MLSRFGWNRFFEDELSRLGSGLEPARVAVEHRGGYVLYTAAGERQAECAGRLLRGAASHAELPAVGDWVAIRNGLV